MKQKSAYIEYILKGGKIMQLKIKRGLWIVFTFNLLVGAIIWWAGSSILKTGFNLPVFTDFVDSIPAITIEDKTVVSPLDMNASRSLGGMPLLYIQTDRDRIGVGAIQDGVYITRKAVTVFNNSTIQAELELPEKGVITPELIHKFFYKLAIWLPALIGLVYMLRLWIFYLLLVGLTALIALVPAIRKKLTPYAIWRYAAYVHVTLLTIDFIATYFGYGLPSLTYVNDNLPMWLGMLILFFVTMLIQLIVAWLVSIVVVLVATYRNKNKKKKS